MRFVDWFASTYPVWWYRRTPVDVPILSCCKNCTLNLHFALLFVVAESKWKCMKPQECKICHKTFSNAGNLRQHVTNVHTPGEPVQCELCSKEFKNKEYLRKHKVIIHKAPLRKHKFIHVSASSMPWNLWAAQNFQQWNFLLKIQRPKLYCALSVDFW